MEERNMSRRLTQHVTNLRQRGVALADANQVVHQLFPKVGKRTEAKKLRAAVRYQFGRKK